MTTRWLDTDHKLCLGRSLQNSILTKRQPGCKGCEDCQSASSSYSLDHMLTLTDSRTASMHTAKEPVRLCDAVGEDELHISLACVDLCKRKVLCVIPLFLYPFFPFKTQDK